MRWQDMRDAGGNDTIYFAFILSSGEKAIKNCHKLYMIVLPIFHCLKGKFRLNKYSLIFCYQFLGPYLAWNLHLKMTVRSSHIYSNHSKRNKVVISRSFRPFLFISGAAGPTIIFGCHKKRYFYFVLTVRPQWST